MGRICHVFDASAGWAERMALRVLAAGAPDGELVVAAPAAVIRRLREAVERRFDSIDLTALSALLAGAALSRAVRGRGVGLIHAWGVRAGAIAKPCDDVPLLIDVRDPNLAARDIRLLRVLTGQSGAAVACGGGVIRRRLIEGGVDASRCVILRPGVDFALINATKRSHLRERLGILRSEIAILLPPAEAPRQGLVEAALAGLIHALRHPGTRVILPGASREAERVRRFADHLPGDVGGLLLSTGNGVPFEQLVCIADVLLLSTRGDIPTTAIAWAMAARAAVIAPAVPAVAEMIAHKVNGLLFNPARARSLVVPMARLLADRPAWQRAKEEAHGQAFEVFRAQRCVEQYAALYDNLRRGAPPGEGIEDAAFAA